MSTDIDHVLEETRSFNPPAEFAAKARINSMAEYERLYRQSIERPDEFWANVADELHWFRKWDRVLNASNPPFFKWFEGGLTNLCYNCVDRHLPSRANKTAILWEGEPGDSRTLTYAELHSEVCKCANALKSMGAQKGDRITIYMPMVPELAIAMLACARIGAVHSIVFGGFSAQALIDRNTDAQAKLMITADGGWRRGAVVDLKKAVDEALVKSPTVEMVLVLKRAGNAINMKPGRDVWWHDVVNSQSAECPAEQLGAEDPLFVLYTSGSTGKPKGILHTTGGYMVGAYLTTKYVFDIRDEDVYWCTADIGWVTGHTYLVYGPLTNGATTLMYEGAPNHPDPGRFWDIIQKHRVNIFYTAPTAIRSFIKWGDEHPNKRDLSSLRLLGSVGEPINPEAWMWYRRVIGKERCPIVDTWWQTETGSILITTLPGAMPTKPGSAGVPMFGVKAAIVSEDGQEVTGMHSGLLVIQAPWPSMLRTLYGDDERYKEVYWAKFANHGWYLAGDGAFRDKDGYFMIIGRLDDVIKVSGHRLGTMEIESALVSHPKVAEAAVVGFPHDIKGQAICAFVSVPAGVTPTDADKADLREHVGILIGAIGKPDQIRFTDALPKTRSGKIMRRLLRDIASGLETTGDTTTLEDFTILAKLREDSEA